MSINQLRKLAGLTESYNDLTILDEAVEIPAGASHDHVEKMLDAAKKALQIVKKLKDPKEREKHRSRVRRGLAKIQAHLEKMGDKE